MSTQLTHHHRDTLEKILASPSLVSWSSCPVRPRSARDGQRFLGAAVCQVDSPRHARVGHQMRHLLASNIMPRTTLDLDSSVLAQLRRRARAEHKSMGQLASERLAVSLGPEAPSDAHPPTWPTLHMGTPSVDLNDKDALWRVLDAGEPSAS